MTEKFASKGSEQEFITRRQFLSVTGSFLVAGFLADGGARLLPPEIKQQVLDYSKEVRNPFLGRAFVQDGDFFVPDRKFIYSHRAGNTIEDIDTAFNEGVNLFDIDATDAGGIIYGEHGFVFRFEILGNEFGVVFDPNELEVKRKLPDRIESLVKHISSLSSKDNPLAVSIDIKNGPFKEETLEKLVDILYSNHVPAMISPNTKEQLLNIRKIVEKKERLVKAQI